MISHKIMHVAVIILLFLLFPVLLSGDEPDISPLIAPKGGNEQSTYSLNIHDVQYHINVDYKSASIYENNNLLSVYDPSFNGQNILSSALYDLNNDRYDELLLLLKPDNGEYGDDLIILSCDGGFHELFNKPLGSLNPWKVQVCEVDGDGTADISLGVYTKSAYRGDWAKRPFIYNFINNDLQPKWLGSRLSKPFYDYIFCDVDKDKKDELLSIELLQSGKKEIMAYKWKGFGFEGIGDSEAFDDISEIKSGINDITTLVLEHNNWVHKTFEYKEDRLIDKRQ